MFVLACGPLLPGQALPENPGFRSGIAVQPEDGACRSPRTPRWTGLHDRPVDGRNPFRTTWKPWLKPFFIGTGESDHVSVSERWCEMDFVHPQYY